MRPPGAPSPPPRWPPAGVNREQMWPAPDRRGLEAAVPRSPGSAPGRTRSRSRRRPARPILVCVNMDGEIASEHYAGVRYRQPEIAALYEPYVVRDRLGLPPHAARLRRAGQPHPVPALRQRHLRRAHRDRADPVREVLRRQAHRAAPHHGRARRAGDLRRLLRLGHRLGVQRDPRRHRQARARAAKPVRGDRSIVERVASRDIHDRLAVEAAYREGDRALRRALLEAAAALGEDAPVEICCAWRSSASTPSSPRSRARPSPRPSPPGPSI